MDDTGGIMKKKNFRIQLYPDAKGNQREETIEAEMMSESTHGNIIFQNKNDTQFDLIGIACKGAFECIKEVT